MPLFAFKSNNHFVTSSDGAILQVHELAKSSDHLSSIQKSDWKKVATISPGLDDDDDIDSKATDDMSYNGLLFFDGHGRIKGRIALTMLAQHLKQLHLLVSPEGYCFQEVSEIGTHPDFGIHYLRLNDLFSWPRHEVDLVTINVWSRLELKYSLPKYKSTTSTTIIGGRVSKEKYAELEKLVKEKDKELEKLKEEMDEAIEKLKQADEEHQKQLKKKDKELRILKMKKDDEENIQRIEELEKLNKDLEEANKARDKELKMLEKKDEEDEEKAQRIEELEKLNEDLAEENKAKDEELQMLEKVKNMVEMRRQLKKKDDELRLLKKKKDAEEEIQAQRIKELEKFNEDLEEANNAKDEELQKLPNSNVHIREMEKQLKTCQNQPWVILPSTMLIMPSSEANMKYLARRQRAKPETFHCAPQLSSRYVTNSPKLVDGMYTVSEFCTRLVDDESITMWPPPPAICVYIGTGTIQDFDNNNWWYAKTTHPEGGLTMLVYYDGKRSQISHGGPGQDVIPLPFSKGVEFITCDYSLSLFNLYPIGMRLGFTYRP
ncbi:hypothetical protein LINPERPRIM_LOCUS39506 [Linum perenne]